MFGRYFCNRANKCSGAENELRTALFYGDQKGEGTGAGGGGQAEELASACWLLNRKSYSGTRWGFFWRLR